MQICDFVMAAAMYLLSGIMFWQMKGIEAPDSRVLPTVIAVLLIVLATVLIAVRLLKKGKDSYDFKNTPRGLFMLLLLLAFVLGANWFGFYVCTPFFILAGMLFLGQRNKWVLILVPVIATAVIVVLFRYIFQVPLPEGTLFNIFKLLG